MSENKENPPSVLEDRHLVRFLAVGRLYRGPAGEWLSGQHQILCFLNQKGDNKTKQYKAHIKAIMNKGAAKLVPGKRIRLTSDQNDYDLQVVADQLDEDPNKTLVFIAITEPDFAKHHSVSQLLKDFKQQFYEINSDYSVDQINPNQSTAGLQKAASPILARLMSLYSTSRLADVQGKVESVKSVMKKNVEAALNNVEHLEELESKSEQFQEHARQFSKNSNKLKNMFRCRYYKINALLCLLVVAIVAYIIYAIYQKVHS